MKPVILVFFALLLTACATTPQGPTKQDLAIQQYIEDNGIEEIHTIRDFDNPGQLIVNRRYIIAYLRKTQYLFEYAYECTLAELGTAGRPPDSRRRSNSISSGTDSFRGCAVKAIYPITYPQAEDLMALGRT